MGMIRRIVVSLVIAVTAVVHCSAQEIMVPDQISTPVFSRSDSQKKVSLSTDVVAVALPAAALAGTLILRDWQGLKQGVFTALVAGGATLILKYSVHERRPDFSNYHSFPSGHSAVTFATAAYIQRRYGWKFGAPAYALATYVAWGRVYARKHHWWDVVAGAAIGAGSAYIFTRPWATRHCVSIVPATDGLNMGIVASMTF